MNLHLPSFSLRTSNLPGFILIILILIVLGYSLGAGWLTYQGVKPGVSVQKPVQTTTSSQSKEEIIPQLKLNNAHQRQGTAIQVDPSRIGRENPFTF